MKLRKIYIPFVVVAITYLLLYGTMRSLKSKEYWSLTYINRVVDTIQIDDVQLTKAKIYLQALDVSLEKNKSKGAIRIFYRDGIQRVSPDVNLNDKVLEVSAFDFKKFPSDSLLTIQYNTPVTICLNGEVIYTPEQMSRESWANFNRDIHKKSSN